MYTLKFGLQTIPVYCHMGNFGCGDGGWTLAMKIDGTKVNNSFIRLCQQNVPRTSLEATGGKDLLKRGLKL